MEQHFARLEKIYLAAPINNDIYRGTDIKISEERAEITTRVEEKYFHTGRSLHGSVYFRMLDDAAYFAVNSIITDAFIYTVSFNLHITRPVTGGIIKSIGRVKFKSKNLYIAESTLYQEDQVVAFGTGNFMKSRLALDEQMFTVNKKS